MLKVKILICPLPAKFKNTASSGYDEAVFLYHENQMNQFILDYELISSAFPLTHLTEVGGTIIIQSETSPYFWLKAFTFSV